MLKQLLAGRRLPVDVQFTKLGGKAHSIKVFQLQLNAGVDGLGEHVPLLSKIRITLMISAAFLSLHFSVRQRQKRVSMSSRSDVTVGDLDVSATFMLMFAANASVLGIDNVGTAALLQWA